MSIDSGYLDQLLQEVKGLFGGQRGAPGQTTSPPSQNVIHSPGGYQAPIHGSWNSSGGFDLVSRRPNGRVGHQGVDMRVPAGTPVYPLAPGVVSNVGTDPLGGNVVNVQHDNGVRTYYAHLSVVRVHKGDKVDVNTVIGNVGNTGNAMHTVPHLHFQVWKDGQITDPAKFFSVPKYTELSEEEKRQGPWLSERAKQEAASFNMKDHLQQKRMAFTRDVGTLLKVSNQFVKLTIYPGSKNTDIL